jgi:hypothetical protein
LFRYADGAFDCTLAYGGPISYAFDQAEIAVAECPRYFLPGVAEEIGTCGIDAIEAVIRTGDVRLTQAGGHVCRMFRWREVAAMIAAQPANCWLPRPPTLCRWATQPRSTGWQPILFAVEHD